MAVYDLEEQEQLDELKTWWRQYGNRVTTLLLVIALGVAGWQGWNWWQRKQTVEASAIFFGVQQAASEGNAQRARELAGELIDKYPRTSYAALAALLSARVQVEKGEAKNARLQLHWIVDNARDPAVQELARLRVAAILLDEKSYDEALKHLSAPPPESFVARFGELRGDVLAAQGKSAEARVAYQAALDQLAKDNVAAGSERSVYREIVQSKLDSLGSGK
jgi:predicted negative regulator of RcsB-dependent stress response